MLTILGIDHIVLRTDKLPQMLSFYCDVLGCEVERRTDKTLGLTQLRAGSALIDLVEVNSELGQIGGNAPSKSDNNLDHFCLLFNSCSEQALRAHFKQHNIALSQFERRYGSQGYGMSVYIKDPQGNTVEIRAALAVPGKQAT